MTKSTREGQTTENTELRLLWGHQISFIYIHPFYLYHFFNKCVCVRMPMLHSKLFHDMCRIRHTHTKKHTHKLLVSPDLLARNFELGQTSCNELFPSIV